MNVKRFSEIVVAASCVIASPALALCSESTLSGDFAQADAVVRARVVAEKLVADDEPDAAFRARWGDYSPVTLHRLKVVQSFKGRPGSTIQFFDEVSSGRFCLDLGEEYLLFLYYYPRSPSLGSITRGAMYVKHTCGPSTKWGSVHSKDLIELQRLSSK